MNAKTIIARHNAEKHSCCNKFSKWVALLMNLLARKKQERDLPEIPLERKS